MTTDSQAKQRQLDTDPQDNESDEEALRNAILRMGLGNKRSNATPSFRPSSDNRRRRFVQDGEVLVEHHAPSRAQSRTPASSNTEDQAELNRLQLQFNVEHRLREDTQRQLTEVQNQLRAMETRAAHAELHVKELQGTLRERDASIAELHRAALQRMQAPLPAAPKPPENETPISDLTETASPAIASPAAVPKRAKPARKVIRPKLEKKTEDTEQEPVKWW